MRPNPVKIALAEGKVQYGTNFGQLRSQEVLKILAAAGFHWAFIDTEHGGFDLETIQDLCRIAAYVNFVPIVRVADLQYSLVARALDCGAGGVIFPRVEDVGLLEKAVSWARFPPVGVRGFGLSPFHFDHEPVTLPQMIEHVNQHTMVVLQIETKRALEMREELLAVPGIDAVMICRFRSGFRASSSTRRWWTPWKPFATPATAVASLRARKRARSRWRGSGKSAGCGFWGVRVKRRCCMRRHGRLFRRWLEPRYTEKALR
jgi:hypothetical protein